MANNLNRLKVRKDLAVQLELQPPPQIPAEVMQRLPQVAAYLVDYNEQLDNWWRSVTASLKSVLTSTE